MADICVVHLVRHSNGLEPFIRFINSYKLHNAGADHDLLIIFKGFSSREEVTEYEKLLGHIPYLTFFVRDFGFDIRPYFTAVENFNYKYFLFLNSFSIILDDNWLDKMYQLISKKNVGLVGATGSWQSMYTDCFNWIITKDEYPFLKYFLAKCYKRLRLHILSYYFPPLPNYHIRTNAFMISRDNMLKVKGWLVFTKRGAWKFESGRRSLTSQILAMKKRVLIVDRNGIGYEKEDWYSAGIYKQRDQANLLIADNQTISYANGSKVTKMDESHKAWGDKSDIN